MRRLLLALRERIFFARVAFIFATVLFGLVGGTGAAFGPHFVNATLKADSVPSTTIDAAASAKKFAAVGA